MKLSNLRAPLALLCIVGLVCYASTTVAQQSTTTERNQNRNQQRNATRSGASGQVGQLDGTTRGASIRASQLIGMNIYNRKEESVGEVNDLVIDSNTGRVRYAAVTYGGFLGLGDKMFAVPFEAFNVKSQEGDRDDYMLTLDVTQEQLEGARGFDQDNWPNFADRNFTSQVDRRYGIDRSRMRNRGDRRGVDVDVNRSGVDVDVDRDR